MVKIAKLKYSSWNTCETSGNMNMHDMVKIDTVVFEGDFSAPSHSFRGINYPGSYMVNSSTIICFQIVIILPLIIADENAREVLIRD